MCKGGKSELNYFVSKTIKIGLRSPVTPWNPVSISCQGRVESKMTAFMASENIHQLSCMCHG